MNTTRVIFGFIVAVFVETKTPVWAQAQIDDNQKSVTSDPPIRLPQVVVLGTNVLHEEMLMGTNKQPVWTARRRFATTRIYVQPTWQAETEFGWDSTYSRHDSPQHLLTQEVELGLPYRFQLDYEAAEEIKGGHCRLASDSIELRWAVAEWGKIWLNPAIKAEWKINNGEADAYEFSLALSDELAPRWHWGANLFYEHQIGGDREIEYAGSLALSYTLLDEKLGAGFEMKLSDENDKDDRKAHLSFLIGPSVQWRPTKRTHLDIAPLFGVTGSAPAAEVFLFFGIEFGSGSKPAEGIESISLHNK